jgi:predicted nuclease with TOPRIM domain
MDDIEQKIEETQRELAELKQRKRDSAGQRINDRLAECNDMLNTLLETGKKLEEDIKCFGTGWDKVVPPELRNELMRKRRDFSSLVLGVKTQLPFTAEPGELGRIAAENFFESILGRRE